MLTSLSCRAQSDFMVLAFTSFYGLAEQTVNVQLWPGFRTPCRPERNGFPSSAIV